MWQPGGSAVAKGAGELTFDWEVERGMDEWNLRLSAAV
jgi:hypothetical protein